MDILRLYLEVNVSLGVPQRQRNQWLLKGSLSSSHTSQGPEPGSGHIFIWVWAPNPC